MNIQQETFTNQITGESTPRYIIYPFEDQNLPPRQISQYAFRIEVGYQVPDSQIPTLRVYGGILVLGEPQAKQLDDALRFARKLLALFPLTLQQAQAIDDALSAPPPVTEAEVEADARAAMVVLFVEQAGELIDLMNDMENAGLAGGSLLFNSARDQVASVARIYNPDTDE